MDLEAEFRRTFGPIGPDDTWHAVVALVQRSDRFEARDRLAIAHGTALGQPVTEDQMSFRLMEKDKLERAAFPTRRST